MSKVVLVTHGKLADGILSAAQLIVGEQSDVKTFGVELGCDLEKLKKGITDLLEEYSKENEEELEKEGFVYYYSHWEQYLYRPWTDVEKFDIYKKEDNGTTVYKALRRLSQVKSGGRV